MTSNPTDEAERLLQLFGRFDDNGDGLIGESEFRTILEALGESPPDEVLSLEFAAMDTNADGMIEFQEFKEWWLDYQ